MPEYLSVEVYSCSQDENLSIFLETSRQFLEESGYTGKDGGTWLAQIAWEPDGSGFGSSLEPSALLERVIVNGHALFARPLLNGWTQNALPELQRPWVSLTLAFETQTSRQTLEAGDSFSATYPQEHRYLAGVGKAVWSIMQRGAALFPQAVVYFTHEGQTGRSWNALVTGQAGLWECELALISDTFVSHFLPVPEHFAFVYLPEGLGIARTSCWDVFPWSE